VPNCDGTDPVQVPHAYGTKILRLRLKIIASERQSLSLLLIGHPRRPGNAGNPTLTR
jgi:hypothetical protein